MNWIAFFIGLIVGGALGVLTMGLLIMSREAEDKGEVIARESAQWGETH
jgi:uncharacterized membrane-anchored protein YhcB (DUF1043 family)